MDRRILDAMSLEQLQAEVRKLCFHVLGNKKKMIDALMTHYEKNSPAADLLSCSATPRLEEAFTFASPLAAAHLNRSKAGESTLSGQVKIISDNAAANTIASTNFAATTTPAGKVAVADRNNGQAVTAGRTSGASECRAIAE